MANPSVYCASYSAITPIHCTLTLKETDVSLKGTVLQPPSRTVRWKQDPTSNHVYYLSVGILISMLSSWYCTSQVQSTTILWNSNFHAIYLVLYLTGPKYHNLMEERLLQSRLNHLENQLRRTTLVTQRQQLHIQKTLNNIPKPSKNLDRRVAEAFR